MPEKIGVYFDESAIKPLLNAQELAEFVSGKFGGVAPVVKTHPVLNSESGRKMIQEDIDAGNIDGVVVCGTSPRVDWDVYDFGPEILVERVNLRELCVMCYQNPDGTAPALDQPAPALMVGMAKDYVKMGVTKLVKTRKPEPEDIEITDTIMVLGGGWTGLTAAKFAAQSGKDVILVEKDDKLGGKVLNFKQTFPLDYPYTEAHDTGIEKLIAAVTGMKNVTVVTGATLEKLEGAPGKYTATAGGTEYSIGAVILATGWVPGNTKQFLAPMGYGTLKNVYTSAEFEVMARDGKIPADKTVAFALDVDLCVAGAEKVAPETCEPVEELPAENAEGEVAEASFESKETARHIKYGSEVSSMVALKQANYVADAGGIGMVLYDHMKVLGINEKYYKAAQDKPGVMLAKVRITGVSQDADGGVIVTAKDSLLGENVEFKADILVLPTPIVPTTAVDPVINLAYRQGPAFPDLELFDGFADSNYICFPYETRRTGVYAAGCVRQPMTLATAREDAAGAALKAIQCVSCADRGVAVHPRSGDSSYPVFNFLRCTQCKRCTEECPFGALDDDAKGTPLPNPTRCRRCGTCMGACPERVISFDNYNIDQIGSAIKEIEVPNDMAADGPRIIVLACENDAYPALDMAALRGKRWSPYVRFLPVRCLGSVNAIWVADAMSKGIDGVLLMGCKYGADYQCHFIKGSELCSRRAENIAETLKRLGVEPERVEQVEVAIDDYDKIPGLVGRFVDYVLSIGPNPFKGY